IVLSSAPIVSCWHRAATTILCACGRSKAPAASRARRKSSSGFVHGDRGWRMEDGGWPGSAILHPPFFWNCTEELYNRAAAQYTSARPAVQLIRTILCAADLSGMLSFCLALLWKGVKQGSLLAPFRRP